MNELKNHPAPAAKIEKTRPVFRYLAGGRLWFLLWLVVFGLAFAWRAQNLAAFGLSNDEGAHLMWARLAVEGYPLYSQTRAVQSPLFLEWVGLAFRLAGVSVQTGRWAILMGYIPLAVSLSWLAYRTRGWVSALVAMVLVGVSPLIFTFSRLVMAEVPATGLAVTSLALLLLGLERQRRIWVVASGLCFGLSLVTKPLNPFVVVPAGFLLLVYHGRVARNGAGNNDRRPPPDGNEQENFLRPLVATYQRIIGRAGQRVLFDAVLWSVAGLIPLLFLFLIYEPAALYDQLVTFRSDLRAAIPGDWTETGTQFELFLKTHWGFWLLAFGGIMATLFPVRPGGTSFRPGRSSRSLYAAWLVWLLAGVAMLAWHTPLFGHHFVVLLPPLILLGAAFVADVIALWRFEGSATVPGGTTTRMKMAQRRDGPPLARRRLATLRPLPIWERGPGGEGYFQRSIWYVRLVLTVLIGVAALNLPAVVEANQETAAIVTGGREAEAISLLQAVSAPDDFVMGDSQLLIFMADRRTPPPLGDVALVAIKAGRQTSDRLIGLTQDYRSPAVVQWSLRLPWLPEYLSWVEDNYLARRVWDNDHIIYFGPRFLSGRSVPHENRVSLGDNLTFYGYELVSDPLPGHTGREVQLKVYWQADLSLTEDYTIFTQLLDSNGILVAGWDSRPLGGYFPTSQWPAGEIITDIVHLPLPANLPAGRYTLITGMYKLNTLERLLTPDGQDHIVLTPIRIE